MRRGEIKAMTGERELIAGPLAENARFRLIVSGKIGVQEIERLIQRLQTYKDFLAG
jgi:hypothetical protein